MAPADAATLRATAEVDLDAVRTSVAALCAASGEAAVMAVVKADGYGHGMVPTAGAALQAGAGWLGVAFLEEALELRAAGITAPVLCWLGAPGEGVAQAVAADVDLSASSGWMLSEIAAAASALGKVARVHLKVDTGLSRAGATAAEWPDLLDAAAKLQADGTVEVIGAWSHLVWADSPKHPTTDSQLARFREALEVAQAHGINPQVRHLANSAATLTRPDTHFDLVRPGLAVYGLSPVPGVATAGALGLQPAMTLRARVALTKRVAAGVGVSYGHRHVTSAETGLALVPLGYADGIPRAATNVAEVQLAGARRRIAGTVCMDQFVVEVGGDPVEAGDEVLLFGSGSRGEPTAEDWAEATGTISYEIVTRIGARVPRTYVGAPA